MDAYNVGIAGWVGAVEVGTAVGGGGEHQDVLGVGVEDGVFEVAVALYLLGRIAERHGDDVDIPIVDRMSNSLDEVSQGSYIGVKY